jgi:hypothetical protein
MLPIDVAYRLRIAVVTLSQACLPPWVHISIQGPGSHSSVPGDSQTWRIPRRPVLASFLRSTGGAGRTADLLLPPFARQALRGGIRSPFSTEVPIVRLWSVSGWPTIRPVMTRFRTAERYEYFSTTMNTLPTPLAFIDLPVLQT